MSSFVALLLLLLIIGICLAIGCALDAHVILFVASMFSIFELFVLCSMTRLEAVSSPITCELSEKLETLMTLCDKGLISEAELREKRLSLINEW